MNFEGKNFYFVGIGGIGMSAIARFFKHNNHFVAGYDLTETQLTRNLVSEGVSVNYCDEIETIDKKIAEEKNNAIIVYTPAIPKENKLLNFFIDNDYKIFKRAEILGELSKASKSIAIGGTHGKTTISSIVSHIFKQSERLNVAFVGGIVKNYKSNFILGNNIEDNYVILEADEFDRSFLNFHSEISLLSSSDSDHLDIYQNRDNILEAFNKFVSQSKKYVVLNEKVEIQEPQNLKVFRYGLDKSNNFYAVNIRLSGDMQIFDMVFPDGVCENIEIKLPGLVNVENAVGAFSVSWLAGINPEKIKNALAAFDGIQRRFDLILKTEKTVYINDYAHHPAEIDRLREAVNQFYPQRKKIAIFQPHLFSRTHDFADGFAKSLEKFDEVFLMDIYPAREKPIDGVTSKIIFDKINNSRKSMCNFDNIVQKLQKKDLDVVLTIGAGSIDNLVEPIKELINNK